MKVGKTKAQNPTKNSNAKVLKTLGRVISVGIAAGIALIAVTDKAMSKAFPKEKVEEEKSSDEVE